MAVGDNPFDLDNKTYIEGKVDGQQIVILTEYVRKHMLSERARLVL